MNFFRTVGRNKKNDVKSYEDFWVWFHSQERTFFDVIQNSDDIEKNFFDKLEPKLAALKDGILYLTGMYDDNTAELILTADGNVKNIAFVEDLVRAAPVLPVWRFTALKPAMNVEDVAIHMDGYEFDGKHLSFYANEVPDCPDEIDITIIHKALTATNKKQISTGVYIFLDNYLGELEFVNTIDNLEIISPEHAIQEPIPISKLKAYLNWRQKEWIEKYDGTPLPPEEQYEMLEAQLQNGRALIALMNKSLLHWNNKAAYPWIASITFTYNGDRSNGMPGKIDSEQLNRIEDEMMAQLSPGDGILNIGRTTANNQRVVYFACRDFREPSKLLYSTQTQHRRHFEMDYDIYKDKYWRTFDRFTQTHSD